MSQTVKEILIDLATLESMPSLWDACFYVMLIICILQTFYPLLMIFAMFIRQLGAFAHFFHKVDEKTLRHGGDLVAQVLKAHGVENIFTLSGGHISPILTAAEKLGIRVVDTRHEVTAVFAADAVSRLSGIPGVVAVTSGPGVTNTITAVKNAQMAESPLILLGGSPATLLKGRGALQDIDQLSVLKSITKWQATVTKVRDIVPTLREAFRQSQAGTPGPVFVECPIDVLYPYSVVMNEINGGRNKKSTSLRGKITDFLLDQYVKNMFAGAFDVDRETCPWPVEIPYPKKSEIQKAVELISKAKKPLILLGSQAVLPPVGAHKLRECIESLGIPVYLGGMSRGLLGDKGYLHMRQARREALKEADLVILGATVPDFRLSYGKILPKNAKIIAVNRNKDQLTKNEGYFWQSSLSIQADVAKFFVMVEEQLGKGKLTVDSSWISSLRERDDKKESLTEAMAQSESNVHLNPIKVLSKLNDNLTDKSIIIADGGDFVGSASYIVKPRKPLSWLDPGAFGTLGCGAGFALGAKLVNKDADVVVVFGDGSLGYSLIEFDTFVRHKLPVLAVVGNDACWTQIAREQVKLFGSDVSCKLEYTNYEKAVEGLGAKGVLLDRSNEDQMDQVFKEGFKEIQQGRAVLINCLIGKTQFREGSLSV